MKTLCVAGAALIVASTAFADLNNEEVKRLNESATALGEIRDAPDKGIPQELWTKARCVAVIPSMKKAAFVFGGEYGAGVMSCRRGSGWTAPVFMQLAKGSWGLQIGAEEVDLVLLVMNQRGVDKLLQDKVSLGVDVSVAGGPVGRTAAAATDAQLSAEMLAYSRAHGLFAGIDLSGGVLRPDKDVMTHAYGAGVSAPDVIDAKARVNIPPAAKRFVAALNRETRATAGGK